jgi:hypothetical protein
LRISILAISAVEIIFSSLLKPNRRDPLKEVSPPPRRPFLGFLKLPPYISGEMIVVAVNFTLRLGSEMTKAKPFPGWHSHLPPNLPSQAGTVLFIPLLFMTDMKGQGLA